MELVNTPTKQPYRIDYVLYKINTKSIKLLATYNYMYLMLSNLALVVITSSLPPKYRKCHFLLSFFLLLHILVKPFHGLLLSTF